MQHEISIEMLIDLLDRMHRACTGSIPAEQWQDLVDNIEATKNLVNRCYMTSGEISFGSEQPEWQEDQQ